MQNILKKQENYLKLIVDNTAEGVEVQKIDSSKKTTLASIDKNIADLHLTIYEQLDSVVENLKSINDSIIESFIAIDDIKKSLTSVINPLVQKPEVSQNTSRVNQGLSDEEKTEAVRREETLVKEQTAQTDLLKKILDALSPTTKKDTPEIPGINPLAAIGAIGTGLAIALGAVAGYIKGYVKILQAIGRGLYKALDYLSGGRITKALDAFSTKLVTLIDDFYLFMSKQFVRIRKFFSGFGLRIMTFFDDILLKLPKSIGGPLITAFAKIENLIKAIPINVGKFFDDIVGLFKNISIRSIADKSDEAVKAIRTVFNFDFLSKIDDLFRVLGETSKPFVATIEFIKDTATKIKSFFTAIKSYFDDFFKIVGKVMPIFEKLAIPLTIIMAIYDTVSGAIKGFQEEGIVGAIKGAITGLFNSLIGGLLDLVKDGISWVAGKLGFTEVEKALDSFSFQDLFKKVVDSVFSFFGSITDWIKKAFDNFSVGAMFGTLPDLLKKAISWVAGKLGFTELEKLLDSFSVTDLFNDAVKAIFGFMSSIGDWVSNKINAVKNFLGFGDTKEKAQQRLISAQGRLSDAKTAYTMGAIGINEQGGVATTTNLVNGSPDIEASRRQLQSSGYREMTEDEKKAYLNEREAAVMKARKDLEAIEDAPTLSKTLDSAKESVSGFFSGIFDKAKEMWDSVDIKGAFESASGIANEYIIDPVKSLFGKITGLIEEYITKPLQTFFAPLVDFFKAIPKQLASVFEYVGVPEIKYKIPIINKEISIGPFYPFRPEKGASKVSADNSRESATTTDRETGVKSSEKIDRRYISEVEEDKTKLIQTEKINRDGVKSERKIFGSFDTQTGTSSLRVDKESAEALKEAGFSVDEKGSVDISNRAFRLLKNNADKKGSTINDSIEILKEDAIYQKLNWIDKLKVDFSGEIPSELIKDEKYNKLSSSVTGVKPPLTKVDSPTATVSPIGKEESKKEEITLIKQEDEAYQKLNWAGKALVIARLAKASKLIKDPKYQNVTPAEVAPNRELSTNVYDRTIRNEGMKAAATGQTAPVIVSAATTNIANNRQNVTLPVPTRNQDPSVQGYIERRNVLI